MSKNLRYVFLLRCFLTLCSQWLSNKWKPSMLSVNDLISPLFICCGCLPDVSRLGSFFSVTEPLFFCGMGMTVHLWILKYQETSWAPPQHWHPVSKTSVNNSTEWLSLKDSTQQLPWSNATSQFANVLMRHEASTQTQGSSDRICWLEVKGQGHFFLSGYSHVNYSTQFNTNLIKTDDQVVKFYDATFTLMCCCSAATCFWPLFNTLAQV